VSVEGRGLPPAELSDVHVRFVVRQVLGGGGHAINMQR
jgi:hypothetical protein